MSTRFLPNLLAALGWSWLPICGSFIIICFAIISRYQLLTYNPVGDFSLRQNFDPVGHHFDEFGGGCFVVQEFDHLKVERQVRAVFGCFVFRLVEFLYNRLSGITFGHHNSKCARKIEVFVINGDYWSIYCADKNFIAYLKLVALWFLEYSSRNCRQP